MSPPTWGPLGVPLAVPFPWLDRPALVAPEIWARFGNVATYIEPFARSLAVLLARPHLPRMEIFNDHAPHVANFWRALKADVHGVVFYATLPVREVDLRTRFHWLRTTGATRLAQVAADPEFHDAQAAGWWLSGRCRPVSRRTLWRASARLRRVRITCMEWSRAVQDAGTTAGGLTGLYLDPPYGHGEEPRRLRATEHHLERR
jgi:site-specific DNA-adenine methylase